MLMNQPGMAGMYKVPKEKLLVLLKTPPSPPEWMTLSLFSSTENRQGQEMISDLINSDNMFLPLHGNRGEIIIVRRKAIRWLRIEEPEKIEWHYYEIREGATEAMVQFTFDDGEVLEGKIYSIAPEGRQRVLDLVNRPEDFIHLDSTSGLFLVNLNQVTTVSVLKENDAGTR